MIQAPTLGKSNTECIPQEMRVSPEFYTGFQQASLDFELKYKQKSASFSDTDLTSVFTQATSNKSDLYKTGYQTGFLSALFNIPCRWSIGNTEHTFQYRLRATRRAA
jgi:hypothetical protein